VARCRAYRPAAGHAAAAIARPCLRYQPLRETSIALYSFCGNLHRALIALYFAGSETPNDNTQRAIPDECRPAHQETSTSGDPLRPVQQPAALSLRLHRHTVLGRQGGVRLPGVPAPQLAIPKPPASAWATAASKSRKRVARLRRVSRSGQAAGERASVVVSHDCPPSGGWPPSAHSAH
jgi:hypothetical protein